MSCSKLIDPTMLVIMMMYLSCMQMLTLPMPSYMSPARSMARQPTSSKTEEPGAGSSSWQVGERASHKSRFPQILDPRPPLNNQNKHGLRYSTHHKMLIWFLNGNLFKYALHYCIWFRFLKSKIQRSTLIS